MASSSRSQVSGAPEPFLSLRSTVIFMAALLAAVLVGGLTYVDQHSIPAGVVVGVTVLGAVVMGLNKLLGH